ncbi:Hypothetical predicted protein [Olea europaea subsp. europaea]|uniref:Uncharacterized protein n=1 Tax=Olea europaea subsp. europaea TaxID=158383 RepID=A0A8S0SU73_OLEEU|nr:Hypothetical predicted protein [Olea europaea subsp. europaea]
MAGSSSPCKSLENPNQFSFNSMYCATRKGSKAQLCLLRILHIISTVRPPQITTAEPLLFSSETKESSVESNMSKENNGSGFDLNGDVCILPEVEVSSETLASGARLSPRSTTVGSGGLPPISGAGGGDQCDQQGEKTYENDFDEAEKKFDLLIEAAKLILGEFKDDKTSESERQNFELKNNKTGENELNEKALRRRSQPSTAAEIDGDIEDKGSPVLRRSKRGRNHVLPNRYRDSVLEPLTRLSRHRSSVVPTKRRKT